MANGRSRIKSVSIDERRAKAVSLRAQGLTYEAIGRILGTSKQVVYQDLNIAQKNFASQIADNFEAVRNEKLAILAEVQRQAWIGWKRSLRAKRKETTEIGTASGKDVDKVKETVEDQAGDSSFLREIREAVKQECEILGIKAPIQIEVSVPTAMVPVVVATRAEILTVEKLQEELAGGSGDDANTIDVEPSAGEQPPESDPVAGPPSPS